MSELSKKQLTLIDVLSAKMSDHSNIDNSRLSDELSKTCEINNCFLTADYQQQLIRLSENIQNIDTIESLKSLKKIQMLFSRDLVFMNQFDFSVSFTTLIN